jgi:poly-D-alanine transfer protein DltD
MKKFIASIYVFFFCALVFYVAALMLWGSFLPTDFNKNLNYRIGAAGYTYTRLHEVESYSHVNILFLGSSHAYRGFDPRVFATHGYTSFNLGTSSQTPLQTEMLLNKHLAELNPSSVVYEVYPYTFSSDGVESSVDLIANSSIDGNTVSMATEVNNIKTYNTLLYAYIKRLFTKEKPLQEKLSLVSENGHSKDYTTYVPGGFMARRKEWFGNDSLYKNKTVASISEKGILTDLDIIQSTDGKWSPQKKQLAAFERILQMLKARNIKVVLVQTPINSKYYNTIKCNKEIDSYFLSKGEYYNFNELMHFDNENDFSDYDHLNETGVTKMNEAFIQKAFLKK